MAMSQRDYQVLADALKEARACMDDNPGDQKVVDDVIRFVATHLNATALNRKSPKFNKGTFLKACDYMKEWDG